MVLLHIKRKLTGKALWPFFWDVPAAIGQTCHIELLHQIIPPSKGEVGKIVYTCWILLKIGVVWFATVADTWVEVCWRSVPDKHYLITFRWLQIYNEEMCMVRLISRQTYIWRVEALDPDTRVQCVGSCPCLVPIAFHPPWLAFRMLFFRCALSLCPPVKVVKLCEVIKESSSSTTLIPEWMR